MGEGGGREGGRVGEGGGREGGRVGEGGGEGRVKGANMHHMQHDQCIYNVT